jgi:hypothetical protein
VDSNRDTAVPKQKQYSFRQSLSSADRNLLLRATLRLFLRRLNHNVSVFRDDLLRVAYYAEDLP